MKEKIIKACVVTATVAISTTAGWAGWAGWAGGI
jgi:hypothetical protein